MSEESYSLHYQPDGFSNKDAWHCPHCHETTDDRPWVPFLFSWHKMDCEYRHALLDWVTFAMPTGYPGDFTTFTA